MGVYNKKLALMQSLYLIDRFNKMCNRHGINPNDNKIALFIDELGNIRIGIKKPFVRFYKTNI